MPRIGYVLETFFDDRPQRVYKLTTPGVSEPGFYRQAVSLGGFFFSTRSPKANVTEVRQFTYHSEGEPMWLPDVPPIEINGGIPQFFEVIGYNPKTRKYASGERNKRLKFTSDGGAYHE